MLALHMGYSPDPRLTSWMTQIRDAKSKDLLPIAWLNTESEEDSWRRFRHLTPYLAGATERSLELGYRIEEIWGRQPGMTMRRISNILWQRGIEGLIIPQHARHVPLKLDNMASVAIEGALLAPRLHRVMTDSNFNLMLAVKMLKRYGYRRIGICLTEQADRFSHHVIGFTAHYFHSTAPRAEKVAPLFHRYDLKEDAKEAEVAKWLDRQRPDVIIGHDNRLVQWVKNAGYRVPGQIGVIHLALDDDALNWAGVHSKRKEIGRAAAEKVISLIQNRQFGIPEIPSSTMIRGSWHPGRTLIAPKTK